MGAVSIVFYVGLTLVSANILADTIAAVGLMIAFYYGLTGFACAWFYRKTMWAKPRDILMQGIIPFLGGLLLLGAFIWAVQDLRRPGLRVHQPVGHRRRLPDRDRLAARGRRADGDLRPDLSVVLPGRDAADAALGRAPPGAGRRVGRLFGLPDSGEMPTVIAPDLSNLPPGRTAVDPLTGETRRNPNDSGAGD